MESWITSFPLEILELIDWQSNFRYSSKISYHQTNLALRYWSGKSVSLSMKITFFMLVGYVLILLHIIFSTIVRHLHYATTAVFKQLEICCGNISL